MFSGVKGFFNYPSYSAGGWTTPGVVDAADCF